MVNNNSKQQKKVKTSRYVKISDFLEIIRFFLVLPIALIAKIFIRDFWLIGEEKGEARDNGYWFFKYVRQNHPEQKTAYVIDRACVDYQKVKDLGKIVQWGSWAHWFWYLVAAKNISSQKGCKPNPAVCYLFEVKLRLWRNKRYFLQHGITINDASWLHYKNCRFRAFFCGAKPEYDFVLDNFGYPKDNVKLTGFCRFDQLHNSTVDPKQILVMPTWRNWLVRDSNGQGFVKTDYFMYWTSLLNDERLNKKLNDNGYKLIFYPHRNMQIFIDEFTNAVNQPNIIVGRVKEYDVQQLLMQSGLLITDYSSVFFDFSYMRKKVLFYQFDEAEFRSLQYAQGYFDYHNNPLGEWTDKKTDLVDKICDYIDGKSNANDKIDEFFPLYDNNNCKRTYDAIKNDGRMDCPE